MYEWRPESLFGVCHIDGIVPDRLGRFAFDSPAEDFAQRKDALDKKHVMELTRSVTASRPDFESILTYSENRFFWAFRVCICLKIHV